MSWRQARLAEVRLETPRVRTLVFACPDWPRHLAGQHVDVRLTADDGYQAQRSYSIASSPEDEHLELTVERLNDGEVSTYLCDVLRVGDEVELRGPIGGFFVWTESLGGPVLLVAGGSGVVPLRAMLRHHAAVGSEVPARLLYSSRSYEELIYREELMGYASRGHVKVDFTLTRQQPADWIGFRRRIDREILAAVSPPPAERPLIYVCGPTPFVESAASTLVELGHEATRIRTERFGPTG